MITTDCPQFDAKAMKAIGYYGDTISINMIKRKVSKTAELI